MTSVFPANVRPRCPVIHISANFQLMSLFSPADEIAHLKDQLALAREQLEQAQSFVFDLRCLAAKKERRGLWLREKDRSGMKAAVLGMEEGLGGWSMIKLEDVPQPTLRAPSARRLQAELGLPSASSFTKRLPPELFYHLVEHTSPSTTASLCLVSSPVRAIASPQLYKNMTVSSPAQLAPFLPNPNSSANRSLTIDKVISLELTVQYGNFPDQDALKSQTYKPVSFSNLQHLSLLLNETVREDETWTPYVPALCLVSEMAAQLDPASVAFATPVDVHSPSWLGLYLSPSVWAEATSGWARLERLSFVDMAWIWLADIELGESPIPLSPSDFSADRPPLALAWSWKKIGGRYARVTARKRATGQGSALKFLAEKIKAFEWPSVETLGIELDVGDEEEDRVALEEDLMELPKEWRALLEVRTGRTRG